MTMENKIYFIEVYENEFGNGDNEAELIGQEEYPSLLAAYDAAKDIPEMYSGFNFDHLEIVDSEDLNRVYYTFSTFNGGKIHEAELRELINNRNNAAKIEKIDVADYAVSVEAQEVAVNAEIANAKEVEEIDAAAEVADELVAMFERGEKTFTFAEIENAGKAVKANTHRFEVGKWYYIDSGSNRLPDYKVIRREKKSVTLIDEDGDIVKKKIVPYSVDYIEEIHFGRVDLEETDAFYLSADYVCTDIDAIKEVERQLEYSLYEDEDCAEEAKKNGVKFLTVILNSYEDYTVFGNFENGIKVHGNKILDFFGDELATFDTPKNAEKVADELKLAFENGEKEFILPTIEELNAQAAGTAVTICLQENGWDKYETEGGNAFDDELFEKKIHNAIKNGAKIKIRKGMTLHGQIEFNRLEMNSVEFCDAYKMTELGKGIDKTVAAIIEYPHVEEVAVNAEIIACIDDYSVDADAAAKVEIENAENAAEVEEEFDNIAEDTIDDELFAQADFINKQAKSITECAAACKYGDLTIEGKVVTLPDKKGRPRYYKYSWEDVRGYECDTSLTPISQEEARNIAAQWHLAFSPMTFEDYMAASNAEYKKIRTIYLKEGGAIARQYDKDLADEIANSEKLNSEIISCLDDYFVNTDAATEVEEIYSESAVEVKKFEVGKIYSCGRYITHTPLKFVKIIKREGDTVFVEDITGGRHSHRIFFDKSCGDELHRNAEKICAKCAAFVAPRDFCAVDEVTEPEWKFLVENLDATHPPEEVTPKRVSEFFADYTQEVKAEKNTSLKAKVAEILNRPRKKIIDWSGTFAEMKISEILSLQKDFKKYLKLGQLELAENVFSMLKTLCKNYREQFAA